MPSDLITVYLPIGGFQCRRTGRIKKMRDVKDGGLMLYEGEVWEKLGEHDSGNLSNFEDESQLVFNVVVEELEVVREWHTSGAEPSFIICPRCHRKSYNSGDIANRYCGSCRAFHSDL